MWRAERPLLTAADLYERIRVSIHPAPQRRRFESMITDLVDLADLYEELLDAGEPEAFPESQSVSGVEIAGDVLRRLYAYRIARDGSCGRDLYEYVKMSRPHRLCPSCAQRVIS